MPLPAAAAAPAEGLKFRARQRFFSCLRGRCGAPSHGTDFLFRMCDRERYADRERRVRGFAPFAALLAAMKRVIRGAICARKREPLNTP